MIQIRKLNMLRGIAALIVIVSHYSNKTKLFGNVLGYGSGQLGVMLFFILSGFLMSLLYMEKSFNKRELKKFMVARFARVVPLFLIVVFLSYFMSVFGLNMIFYGIPDISSLSSHLFLLSGTSILWTIPTEIQFYFVFVLFWLIYSHKKGVLFILFAMILLALIYLKYPSFNGVFLKMKVDFRLFQTLPYFLIGIVFGRLYVLWKAPEYLVRNYYAIAAFFIIFFLYPKISLLLFNHGNGQWRDSGVLLALSFSFFLILFLVPNNNTFLSNKVGDFFGKISYSLYLLHLPLLHAMSYYCNNEPLLFFPVFIFMIVLVSSFSYWFIENPIRIYINRKIS